jgi:hypothetical protein
MPLSSGAHNGPSPRLSAAGATFDSESIEAKFCRSLAPLWRLHGDGVLSEAQLSFPWKGLRNPLGSGIWQFQNRNYKATVSTYVLRMLVPVNGSLGDLELPRRAIQRRPPQRQRKPISVSFCGLRNGWRKAYQMVHYFRWHVHEESIVAALSTVSVCLLNKRNVFLNDPGRSRVADFASGHSFTRKKTVDFQEPKGRASSPLRADGCNHDLLQRKKRRAPVLRSTNAKRGRQPIATAEGGRSDAPYLAQPVYGPAARSLVVLEVEAAQECYSRFLVSMRIVTGPSLLEATFMSAPNSPVWIGLPRS